MANIFDEKASTYLVDIADSIGQPEKALRFYMDRKIRRISKRIVGKNILNILDFGCGIGLSLKALAEYFPNAQIIGTDPSIQSLREARKSVEKFNNIRIIDEAIFSLEKNFHSSFDVIVLSCVLHHVPNEERLIFLSNLRKYLKPGGILAVIEHNSWNPITRKIVRNCPLDEGVVLVNQKDLTQTLTNEDWNILGIEYVSFVPFKFRKLSFIEGLFKGIPIGAQYIVYAEKLV